MIFNNKNMSFQRSPKNSFSSSYCEKFTEITFHILNYILSAYLLSIPFYKKHHFLNMFQGLGGTLKKPVGFRAAQMCQSEPWEGAAVTKLPKRLT
jgi:hypothetical protein